MCIPTGLVVLASVVSGQPVCVPTGLVVLASVVPGQPVCCPTGLVVLASVDPGCLVCSYRVGCPHISSPWMPCVFLQGWLSSHQLSLDTMCVPSGLVVLASVVSG